LQRCSRCGGDVFPGATDCPSCGALVAAQRNDDSTSFGAVALQRLGKRGTVKLVLGVLALVGAWFLFHYGQVTTEWEEGVRLHNGRDLDIKRSVTIGPDEFFRPGRGALLEQSLSFWHNRRRFTWKNDDKWGVHYMPAVLDIIDDEPILVLPIYGHGPCSKYGYPQDGLAAFRYRKGKWEVTELGSPSVALTVNLLRSSHQVRHSPSYKDRKIEPADKWAMEGVGEGRYGTSVGRLAQYYSEISDSCANLRPTLGPDMELARQRSAEAETQAESVRARLASMNSSATAYSRDQFIAERGGWSGSGIYSGACKGIVERTLDVSGGYHLLFIDGHGGRKRVPLQHGDRPAQFQGVVCNASRALAIRRHDRTTLIVHRFDRGGRLIDAVRILLPDAEQVSADADWGTLWSIDAAEESRLVIKLARIRYQQLASDGGTIERMATYEVALPAEPPVGR